MDSPGIAKGAPGKAREYGEDALKLDLTVTLLELGDATSRNLEFSHRGDVWVSYGEETITESNLLEIRRRHPNVVRVRTFPKVVEATNGADWEWRIVGWRRTLRMRGAGEARAEQRRSEGQTHGEIVG